ncbi:MAG: hypothetical protein RI964_421 [Pseudomonadota bacterium]|jgi:outer membrane protein assembly factor BamE
MIKHLISFSFAASLLLLGGCSLYRMEIQQGNYITDQELALVKPGMSAEQVQSVLGTPLLVDDFHKDRWDYVFFRRLPSGQTERNGVTVYFQNGAVRDIQREATPSKSPNK